MVRTSTRLLEDLPGEYIGTRTSAERLAWPHDTAVGASPPVIRRLYELTHWFVTAQISRACRSTPATNALPVSESSYGSSGSWKALRSPSKSEKWVCIAEPGCAENGLGMNDARTPCLIATSLTTYRKVMMLSAMVNASA